MADPPTPEDWSVMGLEPGRADQDDLERARARRRRVWSEDSLATYSLVSDDERRARLERLEAAYDRLREVVPPAVGPEAEAANGSGADTPAPATRMPDPATSPGAYLTWHREQRGLSLTEVSEETKIRRTLIEAVESEDSSRLPPAVYVRGFVVQIARMLRLDNADELARALVDRLE